jgi:hypothetical protein
VFSAKKGETLMQHHKIFIYPLCLLTLLIVLTSKAWATLPEVIVRDDTNEAVKAAFIETFTAADLDHFVAIAKCESQLQHFDGDQLLRNRQGSNARGILQIMTSMHPDPARIRQYNRKYGTNYTESDFNLLEDPAEYIRYGLLLAKVRGTRDWVCKG